PSKIREVTKQFLDARSTTQNCEAGDSPPCITARRGGRDIKKDVAKPPFLERTGWFSDPNKRKTTPWASVASRHSLSDAASPPCSDARGRTFAPRNPAASPTICFVVESPSLR